MSLFDVLNRAVSFKWAKRARKKDILLQLTQEARDALLKNAGDDITFTIRESTEFGYSQSGTGILKIGVETFEFLILEDSNPDTSDLVEYKDGVLYHTGSTSRKICVQRTRKKVSLDGAQRERRSGIELKEATELNAQDEDIGPKKRKRGKKSEGLDSTSSRKHKSSRSKMLRKKSRVVMKPNNSCSSSSNRACETTELRPSLSAKRPAKSGRSKTKAPTPLATKDAEKKEIVGEWADFERHVSNMLHIFGVSDTTTSRRRRHLSTDSLRLCEAEVESLEAFRNLLQYRLETFESTEGAATATSVRSHLASLEEYIEIAKRDVANAQCAGSRAGP